MAYVYDPNHGPSRQNVDSTISNYYQFAGNSPAISTAPVTYLDASNDQGTSEDDNLAGTLGTAAGTGIGAYFGGPLGAAVGGAIGNAAGTALSHASNEDLQSNQFENQKELQKRAYQLNNAAVQNQALNEVIGMRKAGINPAPANGQGAPSLQAGAAAGATSQMGNIFSGIADLIAAAKAPSEIERTRAETDLANAQATKASAETAKTDAEIDKIDAETEQIINYQDPLMKEQTNKLIQDAQNVKNLNDVFKAHQDFVKETGPGIFDSYRAQLKASGQYNKLPKRTQATIDSLADGEIELGIGELEGLKDIIDTQTNLSKRDREGLENMLGSMVAMEQLKDPKVQKALAQMPRQKYDKLVADTAEVWTNIGKLMQETNRTKQAIELDRIETKLREMENPAYLSVYGTYREEKAEFDNSNMQMVRDVFSGTVRNVLGGYATGRGIGSGARGPDKKSLGPTYPSDKGNIFKGGLKGYQESGPIKKGSPWLKPSNY